MPETVDSVWWVRTGASRPRRRLFCFPFAGGSAGAFFNWNKHLPADLEVRTLQLPGRENRHRETPLRSIDEAAAEIVGSLAGLLDRPFSFFGYSLGGLLAFETVRRLRAKGLPQPRRLFIAASSAPQCEHAGNPPIHLRSDIEFLDELRKFQGTPEAVLRNPELLNFLLPMLRGDFAMLETYVCRDEPPLSVPIAVYGGIDDPDVPPERLTGWSRQTSAGFTMQFFPGGHFFYKTALEPLLAQVARELESAG
jgi:medium-chain acyl-[acyl-carrier-protein] hydrolase